MPVLLRRPSAQVPMSRVLTALLVAAALVLTGCGGGVATTADGPTGTGSPDPLFFGADIPSAPGREPLWKSKHRGVTDAASADDVVALLSGTTNSKIELTGLAARSGKQLWKVESRGAQFVVSDSAGPGDTGGTGVFVLTEDTDVPQDGLTPATVRTDLVGRNATDGRERWRTEIHRRPVREPELDLAGAEASAGLVTIAAGRKLAAFDAATGVQRWQHELQTAAPDPDAPPTFGGPAEAAWQTLALGPAHVVAAARESSREGTITAFDRRTGRPRWSVNLEPGGTADIGQLLLSPSRVIALATTRAKDEYAGKTGLVGFRLRDGEQVWASPPQDSADRQKPVLDNGDGTVLQADDKSLRGINALTGAVRWTIPRTVDVSGVAAAGGLTYLVTSSGSDRQVVAVDTRTGRQRHVLPTAEVNRVELFAGAVLVVSGSDVSLHR